MKYYVLVAANAAILLLQAVLALPHDRDLNLQARQEIDYDLLASTPDPEILPEDDSIPYNPRKAAASVAAEMRTNPLPTLDPGPQLPMPTYPVKRKIPDEDMPLSVTCPGYTDHTYLERYAIDAPMDCNNENTFLGARLFTNTKFDAALCGAACSAHNTMIWASGDEDAIHKACHFYNTFEMWRGNVYEGQYCALYTQQWSTKNARNGLGWHNGDIFAVRYSYIARNATYPGMCQIRLPPLMLPPKTKHLTRRHETNKKIPSDTILTSGFCLKSNMPGHTTNGWTVRKNSDNTLELHTQGNTKHPVVFFDLLPNGNLVNLADDEILAVPLTTNLTVTPRLYPRRNDATAKSNLRCRFVAKTKDLECEADGAPIGVTAVSTLRSIRYMRLSLMNWDFPPDAQWATQVTISTAEWADDQPDPHRVDNMAMDLTLQLRNGAECWGDPQELDPLSHSHWNGWNQWALDLATDQDEPAENTVNPEGEIVWEVPVWIEKEKPA